MARASNVGAKKPANRLPEAANAADVPKARSKAPAAKAEPSREPAPAKRASKVNLGGATRDAHLAQPAPAHAAHGSKTPDPSRRTRLFQSDDPIKLTLKTDFAQLYEHKMNDGYHDGYSGSLQVGEGGMSAEIPVNVRTRGQSSIYYAPEPKLKIDLDEDARRGTEFDKEGALEIGVQGGSGADRKTPIGQLLIPEAPPREAATYALLEEMGLPVPRTRVAHIDYVDNHGGVRSQPAFLAEATKSVAKRYYGDGADSIGESTQLKGGALPRVAVDTKDVLRMQMGLALIGNRDWRFDTAGDLKQPTLTADQASLHNTKLIFDGEKKPLHGKPMATDFDFSAFVLQRDYDGYAKNHSYAPGAPVDYPFELHGLRVLYGDQQFKDVLQDVVGRQGAMASRLADYPLDHASKAFIRKQLDAFMSAAKAELSKP